MEEKQIDLMANRKSPRCCCWEDKSLEKRQEAGGRSSFQGWEWQRGDAELTCCMRSGLRKHWGDALVSLALGGFQLWISHLVLGLIVSASPKDGSSLVAQMVKNLPAMQKTWVRSLGREDPLEKEIATHSNVLAWRTSWTEEPGRLQSVGSQTVSHT